MGWWSDAVDTVADAVQDAANAVGETVSDVVETIGNGIEDGLEAVAGDFGQWLGGIVSAVTDLVGAIVTGVFGTVGGVVGGVITLFSGDFREGLGDIFSSIFGGVVLIVLKVVELVQNLFLLQALERRLTDSELAILRKVFAESVAFYNVRLVEGRSGIYGLFSDRPFTSGNTIYLKDRDVSTEPELLVHECLHVWQYQDQGPRYTTDAVWAQWTEDDAYDWKTHSNQGARAWRLLNKESQAEFMEDLWKHGELLMGGAPHAKHDGVYFEAEPPKTTGYFERGGTNYTEFSRKAVAYLRGARTTRLLSGSWS